MRQNQLINKIYMSNVIQFKKPIYINELYDDIQEIIRLTQKLSKCTEIAGNPEENINNLSKLNDLCGYACDGLQIEVGLSTELTEILANLKDDIEDKYTRCEELECEYADKEFARQKKEMESHKSIFQIGY